MTAEDLIDRVAKAIEQVNPDVWAGPLYYRRCAWAAITAFCERPHHADLTKVACQPFPEEWTS